MRWEYYIEEVSFAGDANIRSTTDEIQAGVDQLNELGDGGWEAVTAWKTAEFKTKGKICVLLKRPKPPIEPN